MLYDLIHVHSECIDVDLCTVVTRQGRGEGRMRQRVDGEWVQTPARVSFSFSLYNGDPP